MMNTELTLDDLANLSKMPIRTLRYYIQEGLLPGPDTRGKFASYSRQNLDRIKMIQRLKDKYLPLLQIKQLLENMSEDDIHQMLQYQDELYPCINQPRLEINQEVHPTEPGSKALDYIRALEQEHGIIQSVNEPGPAVIKSPTKDHVYNQEPKHYQSPPISRVRRESWRKIIFIDGFELHISAAREKEFKVEIQQLLEFTRNLLEK
jgi:DNA-binding transcriptional MerR regulator